MNEILLQLAIEKSISSYAISKSLIEILIPSNKKEGLKALMNKNIKEISREIIESMPENYRVPAEKAFRRILQDL